MPDENPRHQQAVLPGDFPLRLKSNADIFIYNKTKRPPKISFGSASFVMRGYVLLRLPDQKTMTGRVNA